MDNERTPVEHNGHARHERSGALTKRNGGARASDNSLALGDVVRDAMDHARVIVRDTAAIAKLEAKHTAEHVVREVVPRAGFGLVAGVAGLVGLVMLLVAAFMGLGALVPSVGWRVFIFSVFFLAVAGVAGYLTARPPKSLTHEDETKVKGFPAPKEPPRIEPPRRDTREHTAPIHPVSGIGE
jgi:hypothetical protein